MTQATSYSAFFKNNFKTDDKYSLFYDLATALAYMINFIEQRREHHAQHVATLATRLILRAYPNFSNIKARDLYFAGLLHDIGEVGIFDEILENKGKQLDIRDHKILSYHCEIGSRICSQIVTLEGSADLIRWHHERWDGRGYPDSLVHDQTPAVCQAITICDSFDAIHAKKVELGITNNIEASLEEMALHAGRQFNPALLSEFIDMLSKHKFEDLLNEDDLHQLLRDATLAHPRFDELVQRYIEIILSFMGMLLEAKHRPTAAHSRRVAEISVQLGRSLGLNQYELETLDIAGKLHDIGKIALQPKILNSDQQLADDEYVLFKEHITRGRFILESFSGFHEIAQICSTHHERYDGKGYPNNLKGDQIPFLARIVNLANIVDNLINSKRLLSIYDDKAIKDLFEGSIGTYIDPDVAHVGVEQFRHQIKQRGVNRDSNRSRM